MTSFTSVNALMKPDGTDAVGAGAAQVSFLADRLDRILPRSFRTGTLTVAAASTNYSTAVTFPDAFPSGVVPVVQLTAEAANVNGLHLSADSITNTGFTLNYRRDGGTANIAAVMVTAQEAV